jgi:hypothetical protein
MQSDSIIVSSLERGGSGCGSRAAAPRRSLIQQTGNRKEFIMSTVRHFQKVTTVPLWFRVIAALLVVLVICMPGRAAAEEITVAAAADLTFAFKDVGARFEKETGNTVKFSFGSSGNFLSQIQNGAPFDMFFSADIGYPQKLEAAGLIEPGTLYEYATGKIVIWVPNASTLDLKQGLAVAHRSAYQQDRHRQSRTRAVRTRCCRGNETRPCLRQGQ